jgi:hypothetical protein
MAMGFQRELKTDLDGIRQEQMFYKNRYTRGMDVE